MIPESLFIEVRPPEREPENSPVLRIRGALPPLSLYSIMVWRLATDTTVIRIIFIVGLTSLKVNDSVATMDTVLYYLCSVMITECSVNLSRHSGNLDRCYITLRGISVRS